MIMMVKFLLLSWHQSFIFQSLSKPPKLKIRLANLPALSLLILKIDSDSFTTSLETGIKAAEDELLRQCFRQGS
jgi:hypothetical protein